MMLTFFFIYNFVFLFDFGFGKFKYSRTHLHDKFVFAILWKGEVQLAELIGLSDANTGSKQLRKV